MGSLKFHYAPIFSVTKKGRLKKLATPPCSRELTQLDWEIWGHLAEADAWAGLNLPVQCCTDDGEIAELAEETEDVE